MRDSTAEKPATPIVSIYQHSDGRRELLVSHNLNDTFGPKAIRQILQSTRWTEDDLRRLGLLT
jgi:hypothetical protein